MKRLWVALAAAMLLALGVAQVAQAGTPPGNGGDKNCIGWCLSNGSGPTFAPGTVDEFARMHTDGSGCRMMGGVSIRDANPPQP